MRVNLQMAFVLHTRNYTDTRILVELFTAEYGRFGVVARSSKKGGRFALLRPFQPLLVSWQGKGELKSLLDVEAGGPPINVTGERLYCGLYLNELLLRVLAPADPHPVLFDAYQHALRLLAQGVHMEPVLRNFELDLLAELGYGISFDVDTGTGEPIAPDAYYVFEAASGFTYLSSDPPSRSASANIRSVFKGEIITALGGRQFTTPEVLAAAKQLCRQALHPLLGNKPLKSRELFRSPD